MANSMNVGKQTVKEAGFTLKDGGFKGFDKCCDYWLLYNSAAPPGGNSC